MLITEHNSGSISRGTGNQYASSQDIDDKSSEKYFKNPIYSDVSMGSKLPEAEDEYEGLYSDCAMNGEALYENTRNSVVVGTLTNTTGNTGAGNSMQPTLDSAEEDTGIYSALGPSELNQVTPPNQGQTGLEGEYSRLQYK